MAVLAAVGENKLMPLPDYPIKVINGQNGYVRDNRSWVLGRLVRDYKHWMHQTVKEAVEKLIDLKHTHDAGEAKQPKELVSRSKQAGLCISVYEAIDDYDKRSGKIEYNRFDTIAWFVALVQLGIAAIPCGIWGDWGVLLVTTCGILLTVLTASLGQWQAEKWANRRLKAKQKKTVILTTGNGSQHAIVIIGREGFVNIEDLATGDSDNDTSVSHFTRLYLLLFAVLWVLLLITAAGLDNDTWFLLAIGGVGIVHNLFTAGWQRRPETVGIHLEFVECFAEIKVMGALQIAELKYPSLGKALRGTYFPASIKKADTFLEAENKFFENPTIENVSTKYKGYQQEEWLDRLRAAIEPEKTILGFLVADHDKWC